MEGSIIGLGGYLLMTDWREREKRQREEYISYLHSLKVGDNVYPCRDGKSSRCTKCVVKEVSEDSIKVEGSLWSYDKYDIEDNTRTYPPLITSFNRNTGECWTDYEEEEPTLTDMIKQFVCGESVDEEPNGDYYNLQDVESYVKRGYYSSDVYKGFLYELGLSHLINCE